MPVNEGFEDKDIPPVAEVMQQMTVDVASATRHIYHSERTPAIAEDPEKVEVPDDFVAEEGNKIVDGWFCGKTLGSGMQGAVFLVVDKHGHDANRVFKEIHNQQDSPDATVGLEREWLIGRQLNTLADDDGFLPGFMQTGAAVLSRSGHFRGMMLEKLTGKDGTKRFEDPTFCDIDYVAEMLRQVLTTLDRAELALGFMHNDMRLENVMEHRIKPSKDPERASVVTGFESKVPLEGLYFKIIDYGHSYFVREKARDEDKKRKTLHLYKLLPQFPKWHITERIYRWLFRERDDVWRFCRSLSQSMEGRTWPKRDERKVKHIIQLIKRTTGFRPRAYFADSYASGERKKSWLAQLLGVGGSLFPIRWLRTMLHAYIFPGKPDMKPKEALNFLAAMPA